MVAGNTRIIKTERRANIAEAEIIVAGGRGLKKAENLEQLASGRLARRRRGRVACVDAGWISAAYQVGQTGKTVCPKLYLAFGISGAIQHLEGMRGADTIVAINTDPHAAIFNVADLGIVGDLFEILPMLIEAIEAKHNGAK